MLVEFVLAFGVIALSLTGLGIGLLLGRGGARGSCATAMVSDDGTCPVCGRDSGKTGDRP